MPRSFSVQALQLGTHQSSSFGARRERGGGKIEVWEGWWDISEMQVGRMKDTNLLGIISCAICILLKNLFWDSDTGG